MAPTPLLIVDDEPSLLEGLKLFLEDEDYDLYLASDGRRAIKIFDRIAPCLVVTDLRMPGMSGFDLIRRIRERDEDIPIVLITAYGSLESAVHAIRLNAFDFICKPIDLDYFGQTLARAERKLNEIRRRHGEVSPLHRQSWPERCPGSILTDRETEILRWARDGKTSWEIGCILGISQRTVKFHFANVFQKLDVMNRVQAVAFAASCGLI